MVITVSVIYLAVVVFSVFPGRIYAFNGELASALRSASRYWSVFPPAHLSRGWNWLPYWGAVVLMFLHRERIRHLVYLGHFGVFLLAVALLVMLVNATLGHWIPQLCSRSADLRHLVPPHQGCRWFSLITVCVTAAGTFAVLVLPKTQWIVKLMLTLNTGVIVLALLVQGRYFPVQLTFSLLLAVVLGSIGSMVYDPNSLRMINGSKLPGS
ncbi:hypothetical protein GCM10023313_11840 [Mucilaginibacter defluvii]|uniref:Uncharacterized protein n=1 Tax=Mucilaginibacter defluvii TaxID=1196019 RepID=A0ABP9FP92_9SPHI